MNRFCIRHSHRGSSRAWRMLLATHSLDRELHRHVVDEHGDCAQCWKDTALAAVDAAATMIGGPLPVMDANGLVTGETVSWLLTVIDGFLEAEQADRRDLRG